jgi:hypothetical protein
MVEWSRSVTAVAAPLTEFAGGVLVGFGLLASPGAAAAIGLVLFVVISTYLGRSFWNRAGEFEFPLSVVGAMVALALMLVATVSPSPWHRASVPHSAGAGLAALAIAIFGALLLLASREIRQWGETRLAPTSAGR